MTSPQRGPKRPVSRARQIPKRPAPRPAPVRWRVSSVAALSGWVALYVATALRWEMPAWTWLAYALPSTLCFMAYASDKAAAVQAGRRTPERVLLCLGLVGGWPGALLAQEVLHHKSRKATFRRMFWLSVGLNLLAFMVLFTPLLDPWTPLYAPP